MNAGLFDSHCHLNLAPLKYRLPELLQEADDAGVIGFVVPGVHPDGWHEISLLVSKYPQIFPAYGIHPMNAGSVTDKTFMHLSELASLSVAIGEIGIDPSYSVSIEVQERAFREQLRIAVKADLPVLVHCRRSFQRVFKIIQDEGADKVGGIMHAYSGSVEMAREFIKLGFLISISGTVTWNHAIRPIQIARELPLKHLVIETDAPDMTPERYRGAFNKPSWLKEVAERLAEIRGISIKDVADATTENIIRILRLTKIFVR